jgi:DNA gyrase/topoisomerase IV subunit A
MPYSHKHNFYSLITSSYIVQGKIDRTDDNTLVISELPIGKWTQDYKTFLEEMMKTGTDKLPSEISDFKEHHTDTTVSFTITASKENIDTFEKGKDGLLGKFKLATSISSTNMTLFDLDGKIHKYKTTVDIIRSFFSHRLEFYFKRKDMLLDKMRKELKVLENKARFVVEVCEGDLVVSNRKRAELLTELSERGYDLCPKEDKMRSQEDDDDDDEDDTMEQSSSDSESELAKGYEYLLGLKIWTLTFERAEDIRRQKAGKAAEVAALEATTPQSIWLSDLDELDKALSERLVDVNIKKADRSQSTSTKRVAKQAKAVAAKAAKPLKKADEWNSDLEESDSDGAAGSDSDDDFFENDDFIKKSESPLKKLKTSSSKSSLRLSGSGKQKVVLGTRTQQRKSISVSKAKSTVAKMEMSQVDSEMDVDKSPKKLPAKKKAAKRKKSSSIVKQALQAEVELVDSDESPKKIHAKSSLAMEDSDSESDESTTKPSKKATNAKKKSKVLEKSICHLSSSDESDGCESHMSVDEPVATTRVRKRLSKPKYTFAESDEDDFEF